MSTATATNLTCDREALQAAVASIGPVVPTKSPKPVLANVLLKGDGEAVTLTATDLELTVIRQLDGIPCGDPFAVLLPYLRTSQILGVTREAEVTIQVDEDALVIQGQAFHYRLSSEDPGVYPEAPALDSRGSFVVGQSDLKRGIKRCLPQIDPETSRFALGGIHLGEDEGRRVMVATDGRKIAVQFIDGEVRGELPEAFPVIPAKALRLLDRLLGEGEVSISWASNLASFDLGHTTITTRLVEGRFPRWQDALPIPSNATSIARLTAGALLSAVDQARIVTSDESRGLDLSFDRDVLRISAQACDVGSSRIETGVVLEGDPVVATFDSRYLADLLKPLDPGATITLRLIDAKAAMRIETEDGLRGCIMPLTRN